MNVNHFVNFEVLSAQLNVCCTSFTDTTDASIRNGMLVIGTVEKDELKLHIANKFS